MAGMGGRTILVALACARPAIRGSWRQALALALVGGLLGGVALGAVAGARRTATAYGRGQASLTAAVPGVIPVLGGVTLAVAGALVISPLAPVGPVRGFDPDRGI